MALCLLYPVVNINYRQGRYRGVISSGRSYHANATNEEKIGAALVAICAPRKARNSTLEDK